MVCGFKSCANKIQIDIISIIMLQVIPNYRDFEVGEKIAFLSWHVASYVDVILNEDSLWNISGDCERQLKAAWIKRELCDWPMRKGGASRGAGDVCPDESSVSVQ